MKNFIRPLLWVASPILATVSVGAGELTVEVPADAHLGLAKRHLETHPRTLLTGASSVMEERGERHAN